MSNIASLLVRIVGDNKGLTDALKVSADRMQAFGTKMTQLGQDISTKLTLPLTVAGGMALRSAGQFETSMTKIETLVGLATETVAGFEKQVLALSGVTGKAPKELADALFVVTSAGARGANAMQILDASAKASAVGLGQTQDVARALTSVLQAYSSTGLTASQATDQLVAIIREGNVEASSLAPVLGRVIGVASNMGVSFAEVGANIATFTRLGVSAEQAVTGVSGVLRAAMRPSEQAKEEFNKLGLSADYLRKSIQEKGLAQALVDLTRLFQGNTEGLGKVIPEIEALSAVLGTAGAQSEEYLRIEKDIISANGLLEDGFNRVSETAEFKLSRAFSKLTAVGIQFGERLIPMMEGLTSRFEGLLYWVDSLSDSQKNLLTGLMGVLAVVGPLLFAVGKMTTAFVTLNAVMKANPYVAVASALVAIGSYAFFASRGVDDLNKKVLESAGLTDGLTGSEQERKKLLDEQVRINKLLMDTEGRRDRAKLRGDSLTLRSEQAKWDSYNAQMKIVRDLYVQSSKLANVPPVDLPKIEVPETPNMNLGTVVDEVVYLEGSLGHLQKTLRGLEREFVSVTDAGKRLEIGTSINELRKQIEELEKAGLGVSDAISDESLIGETGQLKQMPTTLAQVSQAISEYNQRLLEADTQPARDQIVAMITTLEQLKDTFLGVQVNAPPVIREITAEMAIANQMAMEFTSSFGAGLANVVVQGEKLADVLKNIGKLVLSSAIQTAITLLLRGTSAFGVTGAGATFGLIGNLFGANQVAGGIGSAVAGSATLNMGGSFKLQGTDLVLALNRSERQFR